ncbi:hypothetical protein ABZ770_33340 [Streptomyces sp. NPDC006654]|uniref:hypothetical protein n=1 Tax=Streptomyces sp. NPDC006654 TaxID=3156897 RepID=UPI0033D6031A
MSVPWNGGQVRSPRSAGVDPDPRPPPPTIRQLRGPPFDGIGELRRRFVAAATKEVS